MVDMSSYKDIKFDSTTDFGNFSSEEAQALYEIFISSAEERLQYVTSLLDIDVSNCEGVECTLQILEQWLIANCTTVQKTLDEIDQESATAPEWLVSHIVRYRFTNRTHSIQFDVGLCFGELMRNCLDSLAWRQVKTGKTYADYRWPVIQNLNNRNRRKQRCNPFPIIGVLSSKIIEGTYKPGELRRAFDYWLQAFRNAQEQNAA